MEKPGKLILMMQSQFQPLQQLTMHYKSLNNQCWEEDVLTLITFIAHPCKYETAQQLKLKYRLDHNNYLKNCEHDTYYK